MRVPGGGPSAHIDTFARDRLPPRELWPEFDYSAEHLSHYPDRVNAVVLLEQAMAAGAGPKPIFYYADSMWSFDRLHDRVARIATVLSQELGLVPGERVLIRSPNTPMAAACWLAVLKVGGICVTTSPQLRAGELQFIVDRAKVRLALCEVSLAEEMRLAADETSTLQHALYFSALGEGESPDADLDRRAEAASPHAATVDTAADDVALISFTSGTTGNPKGAMHFHRDILAVAECWPKVYTLQPDDVLCGSPSFAFTYGLAAFLIYPLRYQASVVLLGKPTPEGILEAITRHRVTSLYTVPTMYHSILKNLADADLSSLRKCTSAGEHLQAGLWQEWLQVTGIRIVNGLGASELLSHVISQPERVEKPGSIGVAVPGYQAVLLDEAGQVMPPDSGRGRLAVRGPTGCRYLDDPERQRLAVDNGWNLTGDLCEQDADGAFWYISRADDMIISSGYNISPQEVELCLLEHPQVRQCAVVGVPDAVRGHIVRACIVLEEGIEPTEVMAGELQSFVKSRIAPYKYPRDLLFLDSLPTTATGKVQRYRLRELA